MLRDFLSEKAFPTLDGLGPSVEAFARTAAAAKELPSRQHVEQINPAAVPQANKMRSTRRVRNNVPPLAPPGLALGSRFGLCFGGNVLARTLGSS